jgi:hypothetical protein
MFKKVSAVAATAILAISLTVSAAGTAMAGPHHHGHHGHGGRGAALVGGIALGILATEAIRSGSRECRRECAWVPGECWENDYGRQVCRKGHRECTRYCD